MNEFSKIEILKERLESATLFMEELVSALLGKANVKTGEAVGKVFVNLHRCKTLCEEIEKDQIAMDKHSKSKEKPCA